MVVVINMSSILRTIYRSFVVAVFVIAVIVAYDWYANAMLPTTKMEAICLGYVIFSMIRRLLVSLVIEHGENVIDSTNG